MTDKVDPYIGPVLLETATAKNWPSTHTHVRVHTHIHTHTLTHVAYCKERPIIIGLRKGSRMPWFTYLKARHRASKFSFFVQIGQCVRTVCNQWPIWTKYRPTWQTLVRFLSYFQDPEIYPLLDWAICKMWNNHHKRPSELSVEHRKISSLIKCLIIPPVQPISPYPILSSLVYLSLQNSFLPELWDICRSYCWKALPNTTVYPFILQ